MFPIKMCIFYTFLSFHVSLTSQFSMSCLRQSCSVPSIQNRDSRSNLMSSDTFYNVVSIKKTTTRSATSLHLFGSISSHKNTSHANRLKRRQKIQSRRPLGRIITAFIKFIITSTTFFVMKIMNKTYLHDSNNNLKKYIFERNSKEVGLLTISNHCSVIDDPGIWCGTLPLRKLTLDNMRNIVMVEEAYYSLGKLSAYILHGLNCLPIRRGDIRGLESPQLKELHKRLNGESSPTREWCHIMVEGRICQPWRFMGTNIPHLCKFRLGAAKIIASSPPSRTIVLPIYHRGMHNVFPETPPEGACLKSNSEDCSKMMITRLSGKTKARIPSWGNRIDVFVGDPIEFKDIVPHEGYSFEISGMKDLLYQINSRLHDAMLKLEARATYHERHSI